MNFNKNNIDSSKSKSFSNIQLSNTSGEIINSIEYGKSFLVKVDWPKDLAEVKNIGIIMYKEGECVFATNTIGQNIKIESGISLGIKAVMGNGTYKFVGALFSDDGTNVIEHITNGPDLLVYNQPDKGKRNEEWLGVMYIDSLWDSPRIKGTK